MTHKTPVEAPRQDEALFLAAETMSMAGRAPSRRALLGEAVRRHPDIAAARIWHDRASERDDPGYVHDLALTLAGGSPDADLPDWLVRARNRADDHAPYCAEELRRRLALTRTAQAPDRDGPLCYVLHMSLPENGSGYAVRSHHLIRALQKDGLDLHCVTRLGFPGDIGQPSDAAAQIVDGVTYHRIHQPGKRAFRNMRYAAQAARVLAGELAPLRPRAIMAASNHENAAPALLAARHLGVPFIYEIRGFWELSTLANNPGFDETERFRTLVEMETELARQADLVFTLTEAMRDELHRRGTGSPNIHILPNAADPDLFRHAPRDADLAARLDIPAGVPVIGYIGSFTSYEGLDDLVRAGVALHRRGQDFRLLLVGSEPAYLEGRICPDLHRIAAEGGITDKLIMPGHVPVQEVDRWYSLVDIVPITRKDLPVTRIVAPLKPLEAMAMEKCVVVTDLPALKEIVTHGETGIVVPGNDTGALAEALAQMIADPDRRRALGQKARERVVRDRNWDAIARSLRKTAEETLAPGR